MRAGATQGLRRSLLALRQAGKQVWVCLAESDTRGYYLASAADTVVLAPAGHLAVTGLAAETFFSKRRWISSACKRRSTKAGQYKTAVSLYSSVDVWPHRKCWMGCWNDLYDQIKSGIAETRHKSKAKCRS